MKKFRVSSFELQQKNPKLETCAGHLHQGFDRPGRFRYRHSVLPFYVDNTKFNATPRAVGLRFASYSVMQSFFTPMLHHMSDRSLFVTFCTAAAIMLAAFLLAIRLARLYAPHHGMRGQR